MAYTTVFGATKEAQRRLAVIRAYLDALDGNYSVVRQLELEAKLEHGGTTYPIDDLANGLLQEKNKSLLDAINTAFGTSSEGRFRYAYDIRLGRPSTFTAWDAGVGSLAATDGSVGVAAFAKVLDSTTGANSQGDKVRIYYIAAGESSSALMTVVTNYQNYSLTFLEVLGQRISDPGFANDSLWTAGAGWSVAAGKATATTATSYLTNPFSEDLVPSATYKAQFTISNRSAGTVKFAYSLDGTPTQHITAFSSNGTKSVTITAPATGVISELGLYGTGFSGDIDDFSVCLIPDEITKIVLEETGV